MLVVCGMFDFVITCCSATHLLFVNSLTTELAKVYRKPALILEIFPPMKVDEAFQDTGDDSCQTPSQAHPGTTREKLANFHF